MSTEARPLRYFVAVGEELHFGRAAARLHISQPSLSRAIRELELQLGVDLFARTKRSVRLTDAGSALLAHAPRALAELERAVEEARRAGRGEVGTLNVGFLPSATVRLLPAVVRAYRAAFPAVRLHLVEQLDELQLDALAQERLDLGLVRTTRSGSGLTFAALRREGMVVAMPRGHPLAARRRLSYSDLRDEDFVLWPRAAAPETFDAVIEGCRAAGFSPRIGQEAPGASALLGLVAAGLGVSVVADAYAGLAGEDVVVVPLAGARSVLYLAWRADRPSAARDNLIAVARRVAARM
ncbi:MAG: transcriptional regulator, LysR family [Solirubrobacterales bacterium]|nr:transcriptional regulator, LysR family [Solirubrobacterales bacterium]